MFRCFERFMDLFNNFEKTLLMIQDDHFATKVIDLPMKIDKETGNEFTAK